MNQKVTSLAKRRHGSHVACRSCGLARLCLPVGLDGAQVAELDRIVNRRRVLRRGEYLFRHGESFSRLYALRCGSVKVYTQLHGGGRQVTGFHLPGELLGLDAISAGGHGSSAQTLETTGVCQLPFQPLESLATRIPTLQKRIVRIISQELRNEQSGLMGAPHGSAEVRLAAFLMNLSARFRQRGFSATAYRLSMSREDIGSYLGLASETISRLLVRFHKRGLLNVAGKEVRICDLEALGALAGDPPTGRAEQA